MALPITITGLTSDNYLINNEIWVTASGYDDAKWLNTKITNLTTGGAISVRMMLIGDSVDFEISEYIKGLFEYPNLDVTSTIINNSEINTNYSNYKIEMFGYNANSNLIASGTIIKTFIRGGLETQEENKSLPNNTYLKESVNIPYWDGYENTAYRIVNNKIILLNPSPTDISKKQMVRGCNQLHIKFKNNLGGYSYWLFEDWEVSKKVKKTQIIDRRKKDISTGHDSNYSLNVESRVDRRFLKLIRSLISSPEVYALGLTNKIDEVSGFEKPLYKWEQIWNTGKSTKIDAIQQTSDIKITFDFILRLNTQTVW